PPYVTNAPHVGIAWNKTLKDIVIRYYRMKGFNVHDQPGYDCHGLPIEVMIEKSLKLGSKKDIENVVGVDRFIAECKKFAEETVQDFSIYVKLPLVDKPGEFILIWTTTPWTLPANLGVMVHPDKRYILVEVDGDKLIVAKERLEQVFGGRSYKILEEYQGRELEGTQYRTPLQEETQAQIGADRHRVLLSAEHVSLLEGTGAVPTAPG